MEYQINDLFHIIRLRLGSIMVVSSISVVITGLLSFYLLPAKYEATATLLVQPQISGNEINYQNLSANEELVSTYSQIIKSRKIAQDVIYRLKLPLSEKELIKTVKAEGVSNSLITAVAVKASSPKQAELIANNYAISFKENLPKLMKVQDVSILDTAKSNPEPVSPRPFLYMGLMFFLAFNIGSGLTLAAAMMDKSVKAEDELAELLGVPVLATIPKASRAPHSHIAEVFRTLRTNIKYMEAERKIRTLLVTSALPGEGKTSVIIDLGMALAQGGQRVLLIDCDLRKPNLHLKFKCANHVGLTTALINKCNLSEVILSTDQKGLDIIPSGPIPPNPSELLGTQNMKEFLLVLQQSYDIILLDSSPVLPVTDAQIIGKLVESVALVIHSGKTLQSDVKKAHQLLNLVGGNLIGSILNKKKLKIIPYGYK